MSDGLFLVLVVCGLAVLASGTMIAVALIRRRAPSDYQELLRDFDGLRSRLEQLEATLDATNADLARLADGQRFTERLLGERSTSVSSRTGI
jgi:hypothetical protein